MARGGAYLLRRPLLRDRRGVLEALHQDQETAGPAEIIESRSRTSFWAILEHGGHRFGALLALVLAGIRQGALRHVSLGLLGPSRRECWSTPIDGSRSQQDKGWS